MPHPNHRATQPEASYPLPIPKKRNGEGLGVRPGARHFIFIQVSQKTTAMAIINFDIDKDFDGKGIFLAEPSKS